MLDARLAVGPAALTTPNAIGASLGLLGDEWTLLIVRGAFDGARRYGDWKAALAISDAVLTARLGALVDGGVLRRVPASGGAARRDYELSRAGIDLWQLLVCIWDWERRHVTGQSDRLPVMVHTTCGSACHPVLRCSRCATVATVADVDARFGPSGSFERSVPVGRTRRRRSIAGSGPASPASPDAGPDGGRSSGPGMFADTMAIIGNRWSSAVLGAALLGATRFRDFGQIGAPPAIVSDRLRTFVDLGVFDAEGHLTGEQSAYRLSPKGRAFFPVAAAFLAWGERWLPAPDGAAVVATHRACGDPFRPELGCSACHAVIARRHVRVDTGHLDAGQLDAGQLDTGHLDTGQLVTAP